MPGRDDDRDREHDREHDYEHSGRKPRRRQLIEVPLVRSRRVEIPDVTDGEHPHVVPTVAAARVAHPPRVRPRSARRYGCGTAVIAAVAAMSRR